MMTRLGYFDRPHTRGRSGSGGGGWDQPENGGAALDKISMCNGFGRQVQLPVGVAVDAKFEPARGNRFVSVLSGAIKDYVELENGERLVLGFRFAGDTLLMPSDGAFPHLTIEALTPATVQYLDDRDLLRLREDHPGLDWKLWVLSFRELSGVTQHLLRLSCMAAEARIASFLLEMDARFTKPGGNSPTLSLPMSRRDIADYLALKPETVSRNFTRLKAAGAIDAPSPRQVVLLDRERLRSLARVSDGARRKDPN